MALIDMSETYQMTNVGAHIDGTDVYQSNRNLLDNAYFVGGGSQLGDGVFPINQRGQTSYSSAGINLDRWRNDGAVTLYSDGITCGSYLYQAHPQILTEQLLGKTLTASILLNDGTIISGTGTFPATVPSSMQIVSYNADYGLMSILADSWTQLFRFDGSTLGGRHIKAVKLEEGTVSTLANDPPPDFVAEREKCQEYLYIPTFPWYAWTGTLAMATSATDFNWVINTPVPMRQGEIPTIGITGSVYINGTAASNLSIVTAPVGTLVKISGTSAGMTSGQLYPVNTSADNVSVILSAEL